MSPVVGPIGMLAASTAELTIRMVVGLVVVGLLLLVLNRVTRRVLDGRSGSRPVITIRHQQRLDRNASVTLLTAGERNLLVGTAGQSIVLLAEGDDLGLGSESTQESAPTHQPTVDLRSRSRANPIRALQNRTVRRS